MLRPVLLCQQRTCHSCMVFCGFPARLLDQAFRIRISSGLACSAHDGFRSGQSFILHGVIEASSLVESAGWLGAPAEHRKMDTGFRSKRRLLFSTITTLTCRCLVGYGCWVYRMTGGTIARGRIPCDKWVSGDVFFRDWTFEAAVAFDRMTLEEPRQP